MNSSSQRTGFSLVELSIVLVILGLLTGGILAGQSLIRAAELRSVNTEFQRYTTAMGAFRDKYFGLPGDFAKASDFGWGSYNGDNDGYIENTANASSATAMNEISGFWLHLASAGLVEGNYTAIGGTTMTPGTNNPRSRLNNGNWNVVYVGNMLAAGTSSPSAGTTAVDTSTFFTGNYGNVLTLGNTTSAILPGSATSGPLKTEEAWNIDTKLDDALPDQGNVRTLEVQGNTTVGTGCSNQATSTSALAASAYDLQSTGSTCSLVLKTGY